MNNKTEIIVFILFIFILVAWNDKIIPKRLEVSDLEPVRVIGLDNNKENILLSIVRDESTDKKEGEDGNSQEVVSISSSNFEKALRALQNYKSKQFTGGHIKYVIIGEDMAKNNFLNAIDFIVRDVELRLTSEVFIAREMSASDLMQNETESIEKISDVLNNLTKNINSFSYSKEETILDILPLLVTKNKSGLIPTLMPAGDNKYNTEWEVESSNKKESNSVLQFAGFAIFKNSKLIDYLNLTEARAANFVNNLVSNTVISIVGENENKNEVSLEIISSNTNFDFKFDGDMLTKIIVKNKNKSNIIQMVLQDEELSIDLVNKFEEKLANIIEKEIENVIKKSQELNADFLNFEEKLKIKHPYKYRKIKDNFESIFKTVPIEVVVESKIERSYDFIDFERD
ncbi:MAG: Ger(x)C family spore germination protein [Clostridia bacterium]|nr:Ger(x)C family spore germination protein [Clostridia bacterium]